jgi:hypothetical protein
VVPTSSTRLVLCANNAIRQWDFALPAMGEHKTPLACALTTPTLAQCTFIYKMSMCAFDEFADFDVQGVGFTLKEKMSKCVMIWPL